MAASPLSIMNSGVDAFQNKQRINQGQQQIDIDKAKEQRAAEESDRAFADLVNRGVVKPSFHGLVADNAPAPDNSDDPGAAGGGTAQSIYRLMDKSRRITHKTSDGQTLEGELATPEEQQAISSRRLMDQFQQGVPLAQAQAGLAQQGEFGKALAKARGETQGQVENRQTQGIPTTPEYNRQMQLPPGMTNVLPGEAETLSGKVIPPQIRAGAASDLADKNNVAKADREQMRETARSGIQQKQQQFQDAQALRKLDVEQNIGLQRNAIAAGVTPALKAVKLRAYDSAVENYRSTADQADQEQQKANDAEQIIDPNVIANGETFTHPWLGTTMTMNDGVRKALTLRAGQSKIRAADLSKRADQILKDNKVDLSAAAPAAAQPAQGGGGQPANSGAVAPAGGAVADPTAQGIAEYRLAPPNPGAAKTPKARAVQEDLMRRVMAANPAYDATQFPTRSKTRQAFITGTQGQQLNAMNTAIGHLHQFGEAADALGNGSFRPGNSIFNYFSTQFGQSKVTNFDTLKTALSGELASVLSKGHITDKSTEDAVKGIGAASSPEQLKGYIETAIPILGSKLAGLNYQYHQALGEKDPFQALSPESRNILQQRGFNPDDPQIKTGGPKTYKQTATGPGNHKIGSDDGKTWFDLQTGKPVQ